MKNRVRRRRPQCAKTGLTLVETLVAVIILSIALIVYLDVLVAANRATRKGDYLARASQVAAGRIALIQAQGFAALVPGRRVYRVDTLPQGRMTLTVRAMGSGATGSHIKQIDLRITWRGPSSAPQTSGQVEASTLVSELK
jgi:Tfp pilus assembly protein PilV